MSRITQKGATGPLALQSGGTFQTSTDSALATLVGTRWDLSDGREVILAGTSSATTVAPGKLYQDAATISDHVNLAVTAIQTYSANGNVPYKLTVSLGATAVVANQYAGGFVLVNAGTGIGQVLRIASHPAAALSTSLVVTLEDGPNTALSTSDSKATLITPHGKNVIIYPTTGSGAPVGFAIYAIAASTYGFFVTKGVTTAILDSTGSLGAGSQVSPSNADAGEVEGGVLAQGFVGVSIQAGVTGEARAIFANI